MPRLARLRQVHPYNRDNYTMKSSDDNSKTKTIHKLHNPKAHAPALHIPCWLAQVSSSFISYAAKCLYGRLAQWSNEKGCVYRSASDLSQEIGSTIRTVERYIQELKEVGLIGTFHPQAGGVNHFEFYDHPWMHEPINAKLCYRSDPPTELVNTPPTELTVPPDRIDGTPPSELADINKKEIKEIKKDLNPIQAPDGSRVSSSFGIKEMLSDNPLNIPENILSDWLIVRNAKRAKITATAWKQVIGNLLQLQDKGLTPLFCFTTAVARGWVGIEVRFYNEYLDVKSSANKFPSKEERIANEEKIRQREIKAESDKKIEEAAAKSFKENLGFIRTNMGFSAAKKKDEEEMKRLGMSANEYYAQVYRNTRTG